MALIKRGLGPRCPDAHTCRQAEGDRHASSLEARTAELLQRLRAQRGRQAVSPARSSGAPPDGDGGPVDRNRVQLTGYLAGEPLLYDVADHRIAALQLRSERRWRTGPGTVGADHTVFRLTAWDDLADECGRQLHAGDRIFVEGQLRPITGRAADELALTYEIVLDRVVLLARVAPSERAPERRGGNDERQGSAG